MKYIRLFRRGALCLTVLQLVSALALPCAAEQDETVFPADEQEIETFTSGDYTYSIMNSVDSSEEHAVCIEDYSGTEAELEIPAELDGMEVVALGDQAFTSNFTLTSVTLPASVIGLGDYTFANCTNIRQYLVAEENPYFESKDGVLYAGEGSFLMRYPLGQNPSEIVLPDTVTSIGNVAFACSQSLSKVTLPENLVYIGISAFSDCISLTEIEIPEKVTMIEPFTFNSCTNLKTVKLHDGITEIGNASFAATALEEFTIPAACTTIGQQAFAATKLKEITIPATVTDIGYSAFGWSMNAEGTIQMDESFTIYGVKGSAAESYATDQENQNNFVFIDRSESTNDANSENSQASESSERVEPVNPDISIARVVGIAVCGLLIVLIFVFAYLSGRKKKQDHSEKEKHDDET